MKKLNKRKLIVSIAIIIFFLIILIFKEELGEMMNISYRDLYNKNLTSEELIEMKNDLNVKNIDYDWKRKLTFKNEPEILVYHHTAIENISPERINELHKDNGWNGIGYHFYIRKDGTIYEGRPEKAEGAHTSGYNTRSIGISLEGNFDEEYITEEQLNILKEVSEYIILKYDISRIEGHSDLGDTSCPGKNFPMEEIKEEVILSIKER